MILDNPLHAGQSTYRKLINTNVGEIAVHITEHELTNIPLILLHGVYYDHHLWDEQVKSIDDRTVITIDMPLHGESKNITKVDWNMDDCANMLLEILDSLKIEKVIAVGHSWGSMTILEAAHKNPNRFSGLGLCNMPFKETPKSQIRIIRLQHFALLFRGFYMKEACKESMSKENLTNNPGLLQKLVTSMSKLTNKEIKYTDKVVRIDAKDTSQLIKNLSLPVIALVGDEDYVGIPPIKNTITVKSGHISPLEVPNDVKKMILALINSVK